MAGVKVPRDVDEVLKDGYGGVASGGEPKNAGTSPTFSEKVGEVGKPKDAGTSSTFSKKVEEVGKRLPASRDFGADHAKSIADGIKRLREKRLEAERKREAWLAEHPGQRRHDAMSGPDRGWIPLPPGSDFDQDAYDARQKVYNARNRFSLPGEMMDLFEDAG